MQQPIGTTLPNAFPNGGSSLHQRLQTAVDISAHARRIDVPPNVLLAQCSNVGMIQGMNGGMIKSEVGYVGNSQYLFGANGSVLETCPAIGDASCSSFSSIESNLQPLNGTILDANVSSIGLLGQIPRNFSLSDLAADFSNSSGSLSIYILESYSRSPFQAAGTDNYFDPSDRGDHQGDGKRLDTISEGFGYEDFGSD
ncbi:unnamed protein product [Ilex paraguariensis]|uniref:Uncharacterized protein n=1 Tax=Ilex paraguariensis TaxID=185542 RepID=A0ABC8TZS2_9AQUA